MSVIKKLKNDSFLRGMWFSMKGTSRYFIHKYNFAQCADNVVVTPPRMWVIPTISILVQMCVSGLMLISRLLTPSLYAKGTAQLLND